MSYFDRWKRGVLAGLISVVDALAANSVAPIAKLNLDSLLSGPALNSSPVFVSEHKLALLLRSVAQPGRSKILMLQLDETQMQVVSSIEKPYDGDQLFSASNDHIFVAGRHHKFLYSEDLRLEWELQMKVLSKQFPRTSIAGEAGVRAAIFQLATPPLSIKCRNSALLAVSSESLVYRTEKAIQTFTPEGAIRGSIPVDPGIRYFNNVEVAGPRQLFFSTAGNDRITDLNGNLLARVHPPDGWGFRHGWSSMEAG